MSISSPAGCKVSFTAFPVAPSPSSPARHALAGGRPWRRGGTISPARRTWRACNPWGAAPHPGALRALPPAAGFRLRRAGCASPTASPWSLRSGFLFLGKSQKRGAALPLPRRAKCSEFAAPGLTGRAWRRATHARLTRFTGSPRPPTRPRGRLQVGVPLGPCAGGIIRWRVLAAEHGGPFGRTETGGRCQEDIHRPGTHRPNTQGAGMAALTTHSTRSGHAVKCQGCLTPPGRPAILSMRARCGGPPT